MIYILFQRFVEVYCVNCSKMMCLSCHQHSHLDHTYKSLDDVAKEIYIDWFSKNKEFKYDYY